MRKSILVFMVSAVGTCFDNQSINQSINLGSKGKHRHHHLSLTEFDFADQVGKQGEDL